MTECKHFYEDYCCNDKCPICADFCPMGEYPEVCKFYEPENEKKLKEHEKK